MPDPPHAPVARRSRRTVLALAAACLVLAAPTPSAQSSGGPYTLRKLVIAGGVQSSGASFSAVLTVAQPAAGTSSGGPYTLRAGIHPLRPAAAGAIERLFCDGFEPSPCP